jgi:hypothetical protein
MTRDRAQSKSYFNQDCPFDGIFLLVTTFPLREQRFPNSGLFPLTEKIGRVSPF